MTSGLDLPRNMDLPRIAGIGDGITALCHMGNIGVRLGGTRLRYDASRHEFIHNRRANKLLTHEYRKGYELAYTG